MKKVIKYLNTFILFMACFCIRVYAASSSISASKTSITVGSTVKITVKASSLAGSFSVTSSNSSVLSGGGTTWLDNNSATYTFTAKKAGSATISLIPNDVSDYKEKTYTQRKSITIKVTSKQTTNATKKAETNSKTPTKENTSKNKKLSGDANLSSLSLSNISLKPKFDKDTTEYSVEVENEVKSVKISAKANNKEASINGLGQKSLKVGKNSFGIVVVAENGKTKTYTVVVNRKEENPVYVQIENQTYQVVREVKDLKIPKNYVQQTIRIDDKEVPAFYNKITKFTLVALRDENNNIQFYICDVDRNTYTLYKEENFTLARLYILDMPKEKIPSKEYKLYKEMINNQEYQVYKLKKSSNYSLFYALNLDSGNKELYQYDSKEGTVQIYTNEAVKKLEKEYENLFYVTLGMCGVIVLLIIILLVLLINNSKSKKKVISKK